jgi:hypothetical protein
MPDYFELPDTPEVRNSAFVLSQDFFEARDSCKECGRLWSADLARRNKALGAGEITWAEYYVHGNVHCPAHQETLEQYLERVTGKPCEHLWDRYLKVCAKCGRALKEEG